MKFCISKTRLINFYYSIFSFFLVYLLVQKARLGYTKESYEITEFLINYQGGFVRRGLLGEILLFSHHYFDLDPYTAIITLSLLAFAMLSWFFFSSFRRGGYPLFFLPFVIFLGNPIIHDFWVRKDALLVLIFILTLKLLRRKTRSSTIAASFIFTTGILIHESIAFFSFPFLLLFFYSRKKETSLSFLFLIPSLVIFFLVLYFKGSVVIAKEVWDSWKTISFPYSADVNGNIPAAIDGLSWSLKEGLLYSYHSLTNFNDGIYAPIGWSLILLVIYYILTNTHKVNIKVFGYQAHNHINKGRISNLLLLQFVGVFPLFVLGWDYGRWVFFWVTSAFAIYLLIPQDELNKIFPYKISDLTKKWNDSLSSIFRNTPVLLLCLLIGFPPHSWSLLSTINSSSLIIVLKFISRSIEYFFIGVSSFLL